MAVFGRDAMSAYWIYEDMTKYLAIAHRADCRYCNNGAGMGRGRDERASRWLGPYNSEDEIRSAPIRADSKPEVQSSPMPRRSSPGLAGVTIMKSWGTP